MFGDHSWVFLTGSWAENSRLWIASLHAKFVLSHYVTQHFEHGNQQRWSVECVGQSQWCGLHLASFGSLGGVERNRADFHSGCSGEPINGKALDLGCGLAGSSWHWWSGLGGGVASWKSVGKWPEERCFCRYLRLRISRAVWFKGHFPAISVAAITFGRFYPGIQLQDNVIITRGCVPPYFSTWLFSEWMKFIPIARTSRVSASWANLCKSVG